MAYWSYVGIPGSFVVYCLLMERKAKQERVKLNYSLILLHVSLLLITEEYR